MTQNKADKVQKDQLLTKKSPNFLEILKLKYQTSEAQGYGQPVSAYKISYKLVKRFRSYSHLIKKIKISKKLTAKFGL